MNINIQLVESVKAHFLLGHRESFHHLLADLIWHIDGVLSKAFLTAIKGLDEIWNRSESLGCSGLRLPLQIFHQKANNLMALFLHLHANATAVLFFW